MPLCGISEQIKIDDKTWGVGTEESEWTEENFPRFDPVWKKLRINWHSYWVFLLKLCRVSSRGGGTFLCIPNVNCYFF